MKLELNHMLPKLSQQSGKVASFWSCALLFSLFIAFLGFLPHALFSLDVGQWHYMNNAWDEDSYAGYALRGHTLIYRILSAAILAKAIGWLGIDWAMISFDMLFPFLAAVIACAIAYAAGFRTYRSLFLAMCLLLFALNFLALSNASMVGGVLTQLLPFSSLFYPDWFRMWVPSLYENFFSIYRTPEPQIALIIQFSALYLLLRHAQTMRAHYCFLLGLLALALPFIYVSTGIAIVLAIGMYAFFGLVITRDKRFGWMLACSLFAAVYYVYQFMGDGPIEYTDGFVFHSRLPIFSVSMLWGMLILWAYSKRCGAKILSRQWRTHCTPQTLLALVCCVVPFVTLNQQIITGQMVQSRTWDYYTNLPFTACALLLLWPEFSSYFSRFFPRVIRARAYYAAPVLAGILIAAQIQNYTRYAPTNLDNVATARTLQALRADYHTGLPNIMLENTGDDSQVALRLGDMNAFAIAGYQQTIVHFVRRMAEGDEAYAKSIEKLKEHGFAYFDRLGLTPDVLSERMKAAAAEAMGGQELIFFFSYLDSWKPLSDYREHQVDAMHQKIPSLIADYRDFLKSESRRNQFGELLYVTRQLRVARANAAWKESLVKQLTLGTFRPITVYVYRQTPAQLAVKRQRTK